MRQADGSDLLGAHDARNATIGIIYVAPSDDRPSVLEAILMQDKLGRKQVAVVLPENSRAFQRPVDFDGLKNMRRGLKTEIIFVTSGVSGPAEFARQRRFTVYTSWDSYKSALRAELPDNGNAKKGPLLFNRNKPKLVPNANAPAPLESFDEPAPLPPQPLAAPIMPVSVPPPIAAVPLDDDNDVAWDEPTPMAPFLAASGAGMVDSSLVAHDEWVKPSPPSPHDAGPSVAPVIPIPEDEDAKPVRPRSKTGPIPIPIPLPLPLPQTGVPTKPLAPGARGTNGPASPPVRSRNTGRQAAIGAGVVGAGAAAAFVATNRAPVAGGAQPPIRGNVGGSGSGGGGGSSRRRSTRQLLAIALVILTLLLLAGIAFASPMGKGLIGNITGSTITATVTITPAHQPVSDSFVVTAVTGTPDPTAHQVQARILSYTSPSGSGSAGATGSIPAKQASGTLRFINTGTFSVRVSGGTLTGGDGVQISFGTVVVPVGLIDTTGVAVNLGASGNIPAFDINGTCCGNSSITVRNLFPFSGGQDLVPNSVIAPKDITTATNNLISSLTSGAQTALQQQVRSGEQVVSNSLKCAGNTPTADHHVGDQAKSVTVTGTVTCAEEAYDQKAGLDIAATALKTEAEKNPGVAYALVGKVITNVTSATVIDTKNTVSLVIAAQGEWVYQFTGTILNGIKNKLAKESQSAAQADLKKTPGVLSSNINISSGTTMPDAANITINVLPIPGLGGSPTPGSGSPTTTPGTPTSSTTPTGSPSITPTTGLGGGPPATFTPGGS